MKKYAEHCDGRKGCSAEFFKFRIGEEEESIRERLAEVRRRGIYNVVAGCEEKGFTAVPFDEKYFAVLPRLAKACADLSMHFWLEDYSPFPTGSANGAYGKPENREWNKLYIDERHMDVRGPVKNAGIRIDLLQNVVYGKAAHRFAKTDPSCRKRLCIVAYRLCGRERARRSKAVPVLEAGTALSLDSFVKNGILTWDIPEGDWRIFVVFTTYEGSGRPDYMNLLSRESVALEIENVHLPVYEHLKDYLGTSWNGFFYDEPEIGNSGDANVFDYFMLPGRRTEEPTDISVLPWSREMPEELKKRDGKWMEKLPYLWYDGSGIHARESRADDAEKDETCARFRLAYMDAVTVLVRENYNGQVYAFCHERGIHYIGHVLEDEGSHTRLGCGTGHYFRQQYYQDEAGIDVIAGQILPGRDWTASWYGAANADGEFYHYGLAKLASSEAHINPLKKNCSVCETFAMYGQQGMTERKFLVDHLLVNGVNRILFAELPSYEASAEYAKTLAEYTDRMSALLRESVPVIRTAVLYHAQAEWMTGEEAQGFQIPAAVLARNQISYDVIPEDVFSEPERYRADFAEGLTVNGNRYEALIIPKTRYLARETEAFVRRCGEKGFPVFFVDELPDGFKNGQQEKEHAGEKGVPSSCRAVPYSALAEEVSRYLSPDIRVEAPGRRWIRCAHIRKREKDIFLIHNESPDGGQKCRVLLPLPEEEKLSGTGKVIRTDPVSMLEWIPDQKRLPDGNICIELELGRYEMAVLRYERTDGGEEERKVLYENPVAAGEAVKNISWTLELPDGRGISEETGALPEAERYLSREFYGRLVYRGKWQENRNGAADADPERNGADILPGILCVDGVSDCCGVLLNGKNLGKRVGAVCFFDMRGAVCPGQNELEIEVYTSASNRADKKSVFGIPLDSLTALPYTLAEPLGIYGVVKRVCVKIW